MNERNKTNQIKLNEDILPVTPSDRKSTRLNSSHDQACSFLPKRDIPKTATKTTVQFRVFLIEYMENNECDAIGNFPDMIDFAVSCCKR